MAVTSLDILNLSHALKDVCEVNCNTPECLSQTLKLLLQYNLIEANLQFGQQFSCRNTGQSVPAQIVLPVPAVSGSPGSTPKAGPRSGEAPPANHTSEISHTGKDSPVTFD